MARLRHCPGSGLLLSDGGFGQELGMLSPEFQNAHSLKRTRRAVAAVLTGGCVLLPGPLSAREGASWLGRGDEASEGSDRLGEVCPRSEESSLVDGQVPAARGGHMGDLLGVRQHDEWGRGPTGDVP